MINKTYNENCLKTMGWMNDEYLDLVITSPPYDNLREYKGYSFDFENIAKELYRTIKKGGVLVWVVGDSTSKGSESGTSFKQALFFKEIGFNLHDTMIYHKTGLTMNHNRYEQEFEYMFILSKGKPKTFNPIKIPCKWFGKDSDRTGQKYGTHEEINKKLRSNKERGNVKPDKIKGNVWNYNTGFLHSSKDKVAFEHPAIFPEKLAEDHILSWSNQNDIIYDPFMGSGTVAKMCIVNKRNFIGSEISSEYVEICKKRIRGIIHEPTLF